MTNREAAQLYPKLDLCIDGKIPAGLASKWNQLALAMRWDFNALIAELGADVQDNLDWWVTSVAGRNNFVSPLFHYCLCLRLLNHLAQQQALPQAVQVDSQALQQLLQQHFPTIAVQQRVSTGQRRKRRWHHTIATGVNLLGQWWAGLRLVKPSLLKQQNNTPVTLIDCFAVNGHLSDDRYYSGLWQALSAEQQQHCFFVPNVFGFKPWQFAKAYRDLQQAPENYLLPQSVLTFADYWRGFWHRRRGNKLTLINARWDQFDILPLVREEIADGRNVKSGTQAYLYGAFFKRLKAHNVTLKLAVSWFENQVYSKAWHFGLNQQYPGVASKGYQGFYPLPLHVNLYPTQAEQEAGVLPKEVSVIGSGLAPDIRLFAPDIAVSLAPAFRFGEPARQAQAEDEGENQASANKPESPTKPRILVALPNVMESVQEMFDNLEYCLQQSPDWTEAAQWILKPHPLGNIEGLRTQYPLVFKTMPVSEQDFLSELALCDLLISGRSATCMNAVLYGKPVIVIGSNCGLSHIPIPESVPERFWHVAYDGPQLQAQVDEYMQGQGKFAQLQPDMYQDIQQQYYVANNRANLSVFLNL